MQILPGNETPWTEVQGFFRATRLRRIAYASLRAPFIPRFKSLGFSGRFYKSIIFTITACILFGGISLYAAGTLRFYPQANAPNALIVLSRIPAPTQFWTIPTHGKPFHIFHPVEGMFVSAILIACYSLMDYSLRSRKKNFQKLPN
jgi:hypothetical protein